MTYDFKMRNGEKTCGPCGRNENGYCVSSKTTQSSCVDARCTFTHEPSASAAELEAKYGHLILFKAAV